MTARSPHLLLCVMLSVSAGCGAPKPAPKPEPAPAQESDPCSFQEKASVVWNPQVRARLAIPLKILQGNLQAQEAEMLTTNLDLFTEDWITMRESACQDFLVEKTLGKEDYEVKASCLDSALDVQKDIIDAIEVEDRTVVDEIAHLSDALERCTAKGDTQSDGIRANPFRTK